jgi:hypothetical protein
MDKIVFFAIPMLVTIPVAMLLARARTSRNLHVSFGTVILSAFVITFFWLGFANDWEIYTIDYWIHPRSLKAVPRGFMLKIVAFTFIMCVLSALGVVHYYQRRSKKDDHVA